MRINLDTQNLEAFFELLREFTQKYDVQYIVSVKETKDFDLDNWVKEMIHNNQLTVYQVKNKEITKLEI